MAREERNGKRKRRDSFPKRVPDLGYYMIVTDGEKTEENYLSGLRRSLPERVQNRIVIKVSHAKTEKLVETCIREATNHPQYCEPWIVLDRDRVPDFDKMIEQAERGSVHTGWSNPCVEAWFSAYFGPMLPNIDSVSCCRRFSEIFQRRTGREYQKADADIYSLLRQSGDEEQAVKQAETRLQTYLSEHKKPSEMCPATTLHHLVAEIRGKTDAAQ